MSRHFCCCIPVRVAVFVSSLVWFLLSIIAAGVSIYLLSTTKDPDSSVGELTGEQGAVLILAAVAYLGIGFVSLFGFIGSVLRKRRLVKIYYMMSICAVVIQMGFDIYIIYNLFRPHKQLPCFNKESDDTTCSLSLVGDFRGITIAFIVLVWLLQIYVVFVIGRYVKQLEEEQSYHRAATDDAFDMAPAGKLGLDMTHHPRQSSGEKPLLSHLRDMISTRKRATPRVFVGIPFDGKVDLDTAYDPHRSFGRKPLLNRLQDMIPTQPRVTPFVLPRGGDTDF